MPLFLSRLANDGAAIVDLFTITRCDGGLGLEDAGTQLVKVIYSKSSSGAGQDRIATLVGLPATIIISAAAGRTIDDGFGNMVPINLVGGVTYAPDASGWIQVAYCFDNQMFAFDAGGARISLPRSVILFHELAHAFHRANGTLPATRAAQEAQAITDENSYRLQVGLAQRDPGNSNGGEGPSNGQTITSCLNPPAVPPGPPPPPPSQCCAC